MGIGRILLSSQPFFPHPQLAPATTKTTHHAAHPHMHISTLVPEGVLCTVGMSMLSSASGLHPICTMHTGSTAFFPFHTGPRGPLLAGWCTHYVPTTSHQPLAIFCTAPAPIHMLQAWLHCHICMCLSIHVSHHPQ